VDLTLSDSDSEQGSLDEEVLVELEGILFTTRERATLLDANAWLTDEIINAYTTRLLSRYPGDIHCCSTFFYTKLAKEMDALWLKRWASRIQYAQKRLLFIPINWSNSHWALAVLVKEDGKGILRYYDSMMSHSRGNRALELLKKAFLLVQQPDFVDKTKNGCKDDAVGALAFIMSKIRIAPSRNESVLMTEVPMGQPQQTDGSSCGVFCCWWIQRLLRKSSRDLFNVEIFRKEMLETIMANS